MSYAALLDRRIAYDVDGTAVGWANPGGWYWDFSMGPTSFLSGANLTNFNALQWSGIIYASAAYNNLPVWFFFPELRVVNGIMIRYSASVNTAAFRVEGSVNTTNGVDGTWAEASYSGGSGYSAYNLDGWRTGIRTLTFAGPIRCLRTALPKYDNYAGMYWVGADLYGHKYTGETPDDLLFIDYEGTNLEWALDPDWGDTTYGATVQKQTKIKNTSATLTANTITLSCIDTDFQISSDDVQYGSQVDIASIGPGATSAIVYIRCIPLVGSLPGPRYARIVATAGSWT